ncbi:acyl-CoA dehydratase activase [Spirochaeta cellobiosiphila]|uniref:acyl-CoA dehydratase activase n=1 Tax=Spirochaeta cellobiosiphila TaxID=504483 RepID=UPI0004105418|nr:acyl-CoA dehydratase activase [Spirochaeta cellobiosiphila]
MSKNKLYIGLDVGSTTVKAVVMEPDTESILYHNYLRHHAHQRNSVNVLLKEIKEAFPNESFQMAICGSGGRDIADDLGVFFIQEVVSNALAVREKHQNTSVAVELGGQDAKIIYFHHDEATGKLIASDMRMNGSCAGGTGAFIDEVAKILQVPVEEFEQHASQGKDVYDISGRCGVFAKTDIQPLLNQGVSKADIALSTFHAIAKQTIGGLAQGLEIHPPVLFVGGPLTFNPTLIRVFKERLGLEEDEVLIPVNPEVFMAFGSALSMKSLFIDQEQTFDIQKGIDTLANPVKREKTSDNFEAIPFFDNQKELDTFVEQNQLPQITPPDLKAGDTLQVYVGIDGGSTTSKFIFMTPDEEVVDAFYSSNKGEPLKVVKEALLQKQQYYADRGVTLEVLGLGTTGYGEGLFAKAFGADYHTVETVAHAEAALKHVPEASFVLDIGGQDMKAITISEGVVTGITLNEACSAGCGSFLENFASNLGIPLSDIENKAFESKSPSRLGSRCTVFMNSSIITEQKNGKSPSDIVAGLCKSIIENVFTKVIRINNFDLLGNTIVVQGGTFKNRAVLRALEMYTNKRVVRAPYPGEMGAIGIALLTKQRQQGRPSTFIGFDNLHEFGFTQKSGIICNYCSNNCSRTLITFPSGEIFVTGNRCERGEVIGDSAEDKQKVKDLAKKLRKTTNLDEYRRRLLFKDYEIKQLSQPKDITLGIPRVLEFWSSMPFWNAFLRSLGFKIQLSAPSSMKRFEEGLPTIPSDTVCFPAKLVHGHILDLIDKKVDRIFFPMMNRMAPEVKNVQSEHVCAVVKGYPLVIRENLEPQTKYGVTFDTPLFHWLDDRTRLLQLQDYFSQTFGLKKEDIAAAVTIGQKALDTFHEELVLQGQEVLASLEGSNDFAVLMAGRPYHTDNLINHDLANQFRNMGIPVLTIDSLPGIWEKELNVTRAELTNNFHVRMMAAAKYAATHPNLEYVQIVSFGCGHDAVITDEITRLLKDGGDKDPLVLKMDESDVAGPLAIRVKSFVESIRTKRKKVGPPTPKAFKDPYEVKFHKEDVKEKVILVPNVSEAFGILISSVIRKQGYRVESMPLAGDNALRLGKKYVHNDMCFPAQINIGEFLDYIEKSDYSPDEVVLGLAKDQCDCRLAHYATAARRALDEAGYPQVPIITTDRDTKNMHPGFNLNPLFDYNMAWGLVMMDNLEDLRHKIRPYEKTAGQTDKVFIEQVKIISSALEKKGVRGALKAFRKSIGILEKVPHDRSEPYPKVFIIGEYLLNYHPASNYNIEYYLEKNGMEVIMPRMIDIFRREFVKQKAEAHNYHVKYPVMDWMMVNISDKMIQFVNDKIDKICRQESEIITPYTDLYEIARLSDPLVDRIFTSGEGWLIPGEISHHAQHGVSSFVIMQPFGCLPNHITGRGIVKSLKKKFPDSQILSLDFDPDTSFANIENRLQMLVMGAKERVQEEKKKQIEKEGIEV